MILFLINLFYFLQVINKQKNGYQIDKQGLSDFFERIEDLEDIIKEIKNLLENSNITNVCAVGKLLFTLLPNLERNVFLIDDSIELINGITFDESEIFSLKSIELKYSIDDTLDNKDTLVFENFKKSLILANEILFLYKKNSAVKCDITEKLKNIDETQVIFSALLHYLEIDVIEKKTFFDADLVIRELQKSRFLLKDAIKYVEFVALQFDYDECE